MVEGDLADIYNTMQFANACMQYAACACAFAYLRVYAETELTRAVYRAGC